LYEGELQSAINLIKIGDRQKAFTILAQITSNDPNNERAWLWLAVCVESVERKKYCLERVLIINPANENANKYLNKIFSEKNTAESKPLHPREPEIQIPPRHDNKSNNYQIGNVLSVILVFAFVVTLFLMVTTQISFKNQIGILSTKITNLQNQYSSKQSELKNLQKDYENLQSDFSSLKNDYEDISNKYAKLQEIALIPPYISTNNRNITIAFNTLSGSVKHWEIPFDSLETSFYQGVLTRNFASESPYLKRLKEDNGKIHVVEDMTLFVDPYPFQDVIPSLYSQSKDETQFINEVWNIVTQLSLYSEEIGETPRFPLETFVAGGGDCEDTAILFASMILAAPVDWKVQLVYMDIDHPTDAQDVNHVIVSIDTGKGSYLIDTTQNQEMEPYINGVNGWYFDVKK
jgi:hypothetical protein